MIFYTGITLGVLVFVHELGHFLAAKFCGMRVDRFSIGFPPRAFGKKVGDTDYCVSWIPLGGYVKIAGMVDESMDTEFVNNEPQPWEFRAKPMWMRMLVISAGVIMNLLLAVLIFWNIHYVKGKDTMETTEIGYVAEGSSAAAAGILAGDRITAVNGIPVSHWDEFQSQLYLENLGDDITLTLERSGAQVSAFIPAKEMPGLSEGPLGISIGGTVSVIIAVESGMPAASIGLKSGDTLVSYNGTPVRSREQIISHIKQHGGGAIALVWKRGTELLSGSGTISKEGRIGVSIGSVYTGPMRHISYSLFGAFPEGLKEIGQSVRLFSMTISKLFSGKTSVKESFGGPIAIAQIATQSAELGLQTFLWFMAQLSITLAIMNILPIPALDGGHLTMLLVEKVMRREIPHRIKIAIQQAGFILLLAFMAFIIYNDITRF
jgi:regulator of sigma E protease